MTTEPKRRRARQLAPGAAAAVAVAMVTAALPAAAGNAVVSVSAPVEVSGDVPLAPGCSSGDGNGPHAAVDPAHPTHVAVVYTMGDNVAGAVATSTDGGASWSRRVLPGLTSCSDGVDGGFGDPMVAIGAGGTTLTSVGWVTNDPSTDVDNYQHDNIRLLLNRADKFGQPFARAVEPDPTGPDQRAPISFAPGSNTDALVAFERVHYVNNPEFDRTGGYLAGTGGSIRIARSRTGGRNWDTSTKVVEGRPGTDVFTVGLVRAGGAVVLVYGVADATTIPLYLGGQGLKEQLFSVSSVDNGATWSAASAVGTYFYPHGQPQGCCIPDVSVAPDGTLYVAWPHFDDTNVTAARYDAVDVASSPDAGQHWTPSIVTSNQLGLNTGDVYEPAIAAGPHGALGLLFYEADGAKNLTPRIALSEDAGQTWTSHALTGTFSWGDVASGGNQDGASAVGPYQDLVAQPDGFGALVTIGAGNGEDVWWFGVKTDD